MLITIDQEIEAVWKRRFTIPSLLYIVMRMGTLGYIILYVQGPLSFLGPPSLLVSPVSIYVGRSTGSTRSTQNFCCRGPVVIAQNIEDVELRSISFKFC